MTTEQSNISALNQRVTELEERNQAPERTPLSNQAVEQRFREALEQIRRVAKSSSSAEVSKSWIIEFVTTTLCD